MLPPQTRDLAQRLIAYEGVAGETSEPMEFAAFRVGETLRQPLCELGVSARLEGLAERHPPVTEALMTFAESVRNTATVLSVLVAVRSPKPN